jgi:hypothetical protein
MQGISSPKSFQGKSFRIAIESKPYQSREFIYYRYWEHSPVRPAHLGIRSNKRKLIYFYGEGLGKNNTSTSKTAKAWEFYDLEKDPLELKNEFNNPFYRDEIISLREELVKIKNSTKDQETIVPEITEI